MSADRDALGLVETIRHLLETLDDVRIADVMSPHDRVELYAEAATLPGELAVVISGLRLDAIQAMHDLGVPRRTLLDTAYGGAVLGSRNVARYSWRGWELCDALATDVVDKHTGEVTRAVPVETLRAVLPACASESLTSSKWNASAVGQLVDIGRYRDGEPVYEDTIEIIPKMAREAE